MAGFRFTPGGAGSRLAPSGDPVSDCEVESGDIQDSAVTSAKIADATIAIADLATGTDGELITWDASGNATTVAVGSSGQVLTSNGAGAAPTFQAAAGGTQTPQISFSTVFETKGAWVIQETSGATVTFDNGGVDCRTSTTAGSRGRVYRAWSTNNNAPDYNSITVIHSAEGAQIALGNNDFDAIAGLGNLAVAAGSVTATGDHIGRQLTKVSGTTTIYGSNADGTTQTQTSLSGETTIEGAQVSDAGTNVKFYNNQGTLNGTSTTNLPDSVPAGQLQIAFTNMNNADDGDIQFSYHSAAFYVTT